ncbi:MAG: lysozyme [Pseudomonadota bacterium]
MKTSKDGLDLIKRYEGLRLEAYKCDGDVWTIGYGHTKGVKPGDVITEEQADAYLREDVRQAEGAVNRLTYRGLRQSQFDALVSFVFNLGTGNFSRSTLRKKVNAGEHARVVQELGKWVLAGGAPSFGLARRRAAEAVLYLRD